MNRQEILEEAIKCVTKDRNATHGDPEDNFKTIAKYWVAYLKTRLYLDSDGTVVLDCLDGKDVAIMMLLMKVSRLSTSPEHPDHWIDIAGYAACGGGIATKQIRETLYCTRTDTQKYVEGENDKRCKWCGKKLTEHFTTAEQKPELHE